MQRRKLTPSQIIMVCGLVVLLAGCVMSYLKVEPWADYVLVAGALLVMLRGSVRARERQDSKLEEKSEK